MPLFEGFKDIEFPRYSDIVYAIYFREHDKDTYFYVGESSRHIGRLGDYLSAKFSASTDFKVGEAIKYLLSIGYEVGVKYKESQNRKVDEKSVLDELRRNSKMLNDLPGYDYNTADERIERLKIHEFIRGFFREELKGENTNLENASESNKVIYQTLREVKKSLAELYITDPVQKDIFLHQATQFKQWANYIAGLVLTREGKEEFSPTEIREILRDKLIPDHFNRPGASENSLLTHDMEINSDYHSGLPCLQRIAGTTRYKFVGFNIQDS
jgi:hypothetical protein